MSTAWRPWLKRTFVTGVRSRPIRRRDRLQLEGLEDRTVPAVYNVTTTADVIDPNDGVLSLREAVIAANASVGVPDTINLPAGTYVLTLTGANEDQAATGDLDVTDALTIQGAGAANTIVDGDQADRIFDLHSGSLSLDGLTVRNGLVTGHNTTGGGIRSFSTLTLTDCTVSGNATQAGAGQINSGYITGYHAFGGGIYEYGGVLTLLRTTISSNRAIGGATSGGTATGGSGSGGGIAQNKGTLSLTDSLVADNQAQGGNATSSKTASGGVARGGGIYRTDNPFLIGFPTGSVTLVSTTVSGNTASGGSGYTPAGGSGGLAYGGGIYSLLPTSLTGCAVVSNQAIGGTAQAAPNTTSTKSFGGGSGNGGGIAAANSVDNVGLLISNSTISDNAVIGGNATGGTLGNGGGARGGAIEATVDITIANSTVALNTAVGGTGTGAASSGSGGGISFPFAMRTTLVLESTILAGNSAANNPDLKQTSTSAPVVSLGNNLVGLSSGVPGLIDGANGDQVGTTSPIDPRLAPLADNGGPTPTHALLPDSPAIDRGSNTAGLTSDQRGPGFVRAFGPPDVGAFELITPGIPTASASLANVSTAGATAYQFTVTFTDDVAVSAASITTGAVTVTGRNGFSATPTLVSLDSPADGPTRTATFQFTPPGGSWDGADAGLYTVSVASGGVSDTAGNHVPAGAFGSFVVDLPSTYVVANANDSGPGSLRQAVYDANLTTSADTITFDPTFFAAPRTVTLTSGSLRVSASVTVSGPGAAVVTLNGNNSSRIFELEGPGEMAVALSGMTLTAGVAAAGGGGAIVDVNAALTVDSCDFTNNSAPGGGAIGNSAQGAFVIWNCLFMSNSARNDGGAITYGGSSLDLESTTFASNTAADGGAIEIGSAIASATYSLVDCTIAGNVASGVGGAIYFLGSKNPTLVLNSTTMSGNSVSAGTGGGIYVLRTFPAAIILASSIVSGNSAATGPDISSASTVTANYSAVGNSSGFTLSSGSANNLPFGTDLKLGPLANNGGPTPTVALLPGSPAIDAGGNPAGLAFDQRGPGFARVSGAAADIGAFEVQSGAPTVTAVGENAGAAQRSMVTSIQVTFNSVVSIASGAFTLTYIAAPVGPSGSLVGAVNSTVGGFTVSTAVVNGVTVATLTGFSGTDTFAGSLIDGRYALTVNHTDVTANGTPMATDFTYADSGTTSGNQLYRFFGDVTGSRTVGNAAFGNFRLAFGSLSTDPNYNAAFDYSGAGSIGNTAFGFFRLNFGFSI